MTQFQSARPWYRKQLSLAIAGALACCTVPALAQVAEPADDASATDLDTVVVTANKRVEKLESELAALREEIAQLRAAIPASAGSPRRGGAKRG